MFSTSSRHAAPAAVVSLSLCLLAACGHKEQPMQMPPAEVGIITVEERPIPIDLTYMARTAGVREVEVRARVGGILQRRQYEEGTRVQEGALLFRIDPAPYEAEAARAHAQVGVAQAQLEQTRRDRDRVEPLLAKGLVSRREHDQAVAAFESAEAATNAAKAALKTAELNLSYTEVRAPISGLTSRERRSEGSLISMDGDSNLLTRIVQTDPLYIEFSMSAAEAALVRGSMGQKGVHVAVIGADGKELPQTADLTFIDSAVDQASGTVQARATLPNKDGTMLPGQFVRARIVGVTLPKSAIVPSRAILRSAMGAMVWVVGAGDKVESRPVQLGDSYGNNIAVLSGLKTGERVIVDGIFKVNMEKIMKKEDVVVKPVPSTIDTAAPQNQPPQPPPPQAPAADKAPPAQQQPAGH